MINGFGRKSQLSTYSLGILFIKATFTMAAFLFTYLIVSQGYELDTGNRQVDADIIAQTMMYSPVLTMSYDGCTNRLYPGWINSSKFESNKANETSMQLEDYMMSHSDVDYIAMEITLWDTIKGSKNFVYYNEETYLEFMTYVEGEFTSGKGGYKKYTTKFPIIIDDSKRRGFLIVDTIIPNG